MGKKDIQVGVDEQTGAVGRLARCVESLSAGLELVGVFWCMGWAKAWRTRKQLEKVAGLHGGDDGLAAWGVVQASVQVWCRLE